MSRLNEIWVLTRANNRPIIETEISVHPLPHAHFIYMDLPRYARFWKRGAHGIRLYYYLWQVLAYWKVRKLRDQLHFDAVHHVSFATYVLPSFLAFLSPPFIWGPVGGGERIPEELRKSFGLRRELDEFLRDVRRRIGESDPFVRYAVRRAALVVATTAHTQERLAAMGRKDAEIVSHAALSEEDLSTLMGFPCKSSGPFRVLTVARMVPFKALDMGLRAFAILLQRVPKCEYMVVGDGPERRRLERLAQQLGLTKYVTFLGALPRNEVFEQLRNCDVFLFPTLHDSSGWASLEAMAAGKPVICLDLGGPAIQVTDDCGIKVHPGNAGQVVADLAAGLALLAEDPSLRMRMGQAARARVKTHYEWSQLAARFDKAYRNLVGAVPNDAVAISRTRLRSMEESTQNQREALL